MTPDCCKNCARLSGGSCCDYVKCPRWRTWFRHEWASIQSAAQLIKEGRRNGKN